MSEPMTPDRAKLPSTRWLITGLALLVVRTALAAVGIDLLDLPITVGMWLAFVWAASHSGWESGYRARDRRATDTRECA